MNDIVDKIARLFVSVQCYNISTDLQGESIPSGKRILAGIEQSISGT